MVPNGTNVRDFGLPGSQAKAGFDAKALRISYPYLPRLLTGKMVSLRTEIFLVKTFRILLPAILVIMLWWTIEAPDSLRISLLDSLGANANHLVFFGGLAVIVILYKFMGIYERKIFYESRHLRSPLLRRPEE